MRHNCPACNEPLEFLSDFPYRDIDGSLFNFTGQLKTCPSCGLGLVDSHLTDPLIENYYATQCLYSALGGVGVGGRTPEDINRYEIYANLLKPFVEEITAGSGLVDVGCSRGGTLVYLKETYPDLPLTGVDIDTVSLNHLTGTGIDFRRGDALRLPFADASQSMLSYFHVFEHIIDTQAVISEALRTLKDDGLLLIEVPDAPAYGHAPSRIGTMFWLGLKEHVYHFTAKTLTLMLQRNGMRILDVQHSYMPMRGGSSYPSLIILARKGSGETAAAPHEEKAENVFGSYVAHELAAFQGQRAKLDAFLAGRDEVSLWGVGLEFLNLWAHYGPQLKDGRTVRFLDRNEGKQGLQIDGITVEAPSKSGGGLICCSYMAAPAIARSAQELGWAPEDIFILE